MAEYTFTIRNNGPDCIEFIDMHGNCRWKMERNPGTSVWSANECGFTGHPGTSQSFMKTYEFAAAAFAKECIHELSETLAESTVRVFGTPGSISHGTMRAEDILPAFSDALRTLAIANDEYDLHKERLEEAARFCDFWASGLGYLSNEAAESCDELIAEIVDALGEYAPDGHYFGAHEGDGSDYGFWPHPN